MKTIELTTQVVTLLVAARRVALENDARAVVILADVAYDFLSVQRQLERMKIVVASSRDEVRKRRSKRGCTSLRCNLKLRRDRCS